MSLIEKTKSYLQNDHLIRRVLRNSSYLFSSSTVASALGVIQGVLVVRLVADTGFGLLTVIMDFASNVNRLLSFRMSEVTVKYMGEALAQDDKDRAAAIVKGIGLTEAVTSVIAYLVLLLLSVWGARTFADDASIAYLFRFYGLFLLANLVYETSVGVLQAVDNFKRVALANFYQSIVLTILIVAAFILKWGVPGLLLAYFIGKAVAGFMVTGFAWRELNEKLGRHWTHAPLTLVPNWKAILGFAFSTNLNGTVNLFARDNIRLYLAALLSTAEVGYFTLASRLINLIMVPLEPFIWPTYAEITKTIAQKQWGATHKLLKQVSAIGATWTLLAGGGLAAIGWWLIPFMYGDVMAPAYACFLILLIGYGIANTANWNRPLLLALGRPNLPLVVSAVTGAVEIVLLFIFVPQGGYLLGAAIVSGYFAISILWTVLQGLSILKQQEQSSNDFSRFHEERLKSPLRRKIVAIAGSQIPSDTANSLQVMKACNALVQLGHDLTLIVPAFDLRLSTFDLKQHYGLQTDIHIEYLASSNRRLFPWQAVWHARKLKPDIIYSWFIQSAVMGLFLRIPSVFEIHIQPSGALGPAWHRAFALLRGRKRIASITQAMMDLLERKHHIRFHADEVVITPNGVDMERFASLPDPVTARQKLNFPPALTVMCTGHLYAGRGADLFLALAKEIPHAHFVWVGGKPDDVATWKTRVQSDNVTFTGFIPNQELPLYQSAADVLLMPYSRSIMGSSGNADSAAVASPMKMFEYMAVGRAIVTSDLPVIREVLDESSAVFCEPDDVQNWKMEIEKLLADEPRRVALGEQAKQGVYGYTWLARAEKIVTGL